MGEEALPGAHSGLLELVTRYLDGQSNESEHRSLNDRLSTSAGARDLFVRVVRLHGLLIERLPKVGTEEEAEALFRGLDDGVSAHEPMDDAGPGPGLQESNPSAPSQARALPSRRVPWRLAAIIVLPLLLGLGLVWLLHPQPPAAGEKADSAVAVAAVTSQAGARWETSAGRTALPGTSLEAGKALSLADGFAELSLAGGGQIIIEAPARLVLVSGSAISLLSGKLTARMSGGGLVVSTPAATITDLGTEFGVEARSDGTTEIDVLEGRVNAVPLHPSPGAPSPDVLSAGQTINISAAGKMTATEGGASAQKFVRKLSEDAVTSLSLSDLIAGGDGTTGRRGTAIDYATGRAGMFPIIGNHQGDYIYHRVADLPAVDGCFIPDGSRGPVRVDSIGHSFAFPNTSNTSYNHIWAGGPIPGLPRFHPISTVLGGVDYARPSHGLIFMSANKGVTLDLAVIGRLHPARSVARFQCTVGNSYVAIPGEAHQHPHADVYVIVDGGIRFERRTFVNTQGPFQVDIPIGNADRFLTLVATDGGDGISGDGIIWGDPLLELVGRP